MPDAYKIFDFVLAPEDKIKIEYSGPDPFRICGMLSKMLQIRFHGRGKNVFEERFKWDVTSDPREFFVQVRFGDTKFDKFTTFEVKIKIFGLQPSDPKSPKGMIYMEIKPEITTTYKFRNIFEKIIGMPFVWLYHKAIYSNVRRRYMQILKEWTFQLAADIREELGIPYEMPELTGAGRRID
jgi:hypothetical protein